MDAYQGAFHARTFRYQSRQAKKFLNDVVPLLASQDGVVGAAGSYCLYDFDNSLFEESNSTPNDFDIFVCGMYGETKSSFCNFMQIVTDNAKMHGVYSVEKRKMWKNNYVYSDESILICDIWVAGFDVKFSFVQCPRDSNIWSVVERFDIDIVKLCYNIHTGICLPKPGIKEMIEKRCLHVCNFDTKHSAPTNFEKRKIISTLRRMNKYHSRGFVIENYPNINGKCIMETRHQGEYGILEPELNSLTNHDQQGWTLKNTKDRIYNAFRCLKSFPNTIFFNRRLLVIGYTPALLYCLKQVNSLPRRIKMDQVKISPIDYIDVFFCVQSKKLFVQAILSFLMKAFGSAYYYQVVTQSEDTVPGFSDKVYTFTVTFQGSSMIGYRFIRLTSDLNIDELLDRQDFSLHKVYLNIHSGNLHPSTEAALTIKTGFIRCYKYRFASQSPKLHEIDWFCRLLTQMQRLHRVGWRFINYPTLVEER